jgi:hypothetical protein
MSENEAGGFAVKFVPEEEMFGSLDFEPSTSPPKNRRKRSATIAHSRPKSIKITRKFFISFF